MATEQSSRVQLRCADLALFVVPVSLALQRPTRIANAAGTGVLVLDLPWGVFGSGVATVVTYWVGRTAAAAAQGADLREFDGEFVRGLKHDALIDLIHAVHHLGDEDLFNLVSGSRGKSH